jgi:hypothetical protein
MGGDYRRFATLLATLMIAADVGNLLLVRAIGERITTRRRDECGIVAFVLATLLVFCL